MTTFSAEVKNELCQPRIERKCCAVAEAYGVLLFCSVFNAREIRIATASEDFAQRLPALFKKAFNLRFDRVGGSGSGRWSFCISDAEKIKSIFDTLGSGTDSLSLHINFGIIEEPCDRAAFLRGAFLAGGSVTDPEKRYHLEFSTGHGAVAREAAYAMQELGFTPGQSERRGNQLLYFKRSDEIADVLTAIGASNCSMKVVAAKIEKGMNNSVMRQVNCDSANADRTVKAAQQQLEDILRIKRDYGLDALPEPLYEAALLRLANPEVSLADLSALSFPHVSKSCLAHRMRKIAVFGTEEE